MHARSSLSALALAALVAPLSAQSLELTVAGGSVPGSLDISQGPGPIGKGTAVFLSVTAGPTPLAAIDPRDPRFLCVGTESFGLAFGGVFLPPNGMYTAPTIPVPNDPGLVGGAIYWHGIDFPGTNRLVGRLSNALVTRFEKAETFKDRSTVLTTARSFGEILPIGDEGQWMISGGGQGGILAQIALKSSEIYDHKKDTWSRGPDMNLEHTLMQVTELADGKWLVSGGLDVQQRPQENCEVWDPIAQTFTMTGAMGIKRSGHRCVRLPNGKVLATGGVALPAQVGNFLTILLSTQATTELWDPATGKWTPGPNLSTPRASHEMVELPNGKFLIIGGVTVVTLGSTKVPTITATTDIYDPATNTIAPGPAMNGPRAAFAHLQMGNKILVCGGGATISLTNPGVPTDQTEMFDATTNTWTLLGKMNEPRAFCDAFEVPGNRVIVIGGFKGDLVRSIGHASSEFLDLNTNTWKFGPSMPTASAAYTFHEMPTGQIQIVGGQGSNQLAQFRTLDYYR